MKVYVTEDIYNEWCYAWAEIGQAAGLVHNLAIACDETGSVENRATAVKAFVAVLTGHMQGTRRGLVLAINTARRWVEDLADEVAEAL